VCVSVCAVLLYTYITGVLQEALHSLTSDPGLYQMLPHFSTFISEGVSCVYHIQLHCLLWTCVRNCIQ